MTLKEFIIDTFAENMIEFDDGKVEAMIKEITGYAKQKQNDGCAVLDNEEVRQFILDKKSLLEKMDQERKERQVQLAKEAEEKKQEKIAKELEKERMTSEGEQMSLF